MPLSYRNARKRPVIHLQRLSGAGFETPLLTFLRCLREVVILIDAKHFGCGNMPRPAC